MEVQTKCVTSVTTPKAKIVPPSRGLKMNTRGSNHVSKKKWTILLKVSRYYRFITSRDEL